MSGAELTQRAVVRQLAALPAAAYELRLIDGDRQCRAWRIWSASQLCGPGVVAWLRARNAAGCEVYFRPGCGALNAGYVLLDFDAGRCPLPAMRAAGQGPCVVVRSSPQREQAWVRIAPHPLAPGFATAAARGLAQRYGADPASAEWRHLGRLAGFTNGKPQHRDARGLSPWVRLVWSDPAAPVCVLPGLSEREPTGRAPAPDRVGSALPQYRDWLARAGVRLPVTDWSVADYRVARALLGAGVGVEAVAVVLRAGSPGFPRRHFAPEDYLRRTVTRAAAELRESRAFTAAPER